MEWIILILIIIFFYKKLAGTDKRIDKLEKELKKLSTSKTPSFLVTSEKQENLNNEQKTTSGQTLVSLNHETNKPSPNLNLWEWLSIDWPLKIGSLFIILGFGWLITYAFMNNWIGAGGRITLGMITGSLILLSGHYRLKKFRHQGLIIELLGTAIFLITIYAAQNIYQMFPPIIALISSILPMFLLAYSSLVYNDRWLAMAGLITGGIAPLLTGADSGNILGLYSYLLILCAGTLWLSKFTNWNFLTPTALMIVSLYSVKYFSQNYISISSQLTPLNLLQLKFFSLTFVSLFFFSNLISILYSKITSKSQLITALLIGLFALSWINSLTPEYLQSIVSLVVAIVFAIVSFLTYQKTNNPSPVIIYSTSALLLLTAASVYQFDGPQLVIVLSVIATLIPIVSLDLLGNKVSFSLIWYLLLPIFLAIPSFGSHLWKQGIWHNDFYALVSVATATWIISLYLYFHKQKFIQSKNTINVENNKSLLSINESHVKTVTNIVLITASLFSIGLIWKVFHATIKPLYLARMLTLSIYIITGLICYFQGKHLQRKILYHYGQILTAGVIGWLLLVEMGDMTLVGKIITFLVIGGILIGSVLIRRPNKSKMTNIIPLFILLLGWSTASSSVLAKTTKKPTPNLQQQLSVFHNYMQIPPLSLKIPKIIELPLNTNETNYNHQAVFETTTQTLQPFKIITTQIPTNFTITNETENTLKTKLNDNLLQTYEEYVPNPNSQINQKIFILTYNTPITSDTLQITFPINVQLPNKITIATKDNPFNSFNRILVKDKTLTQPVIKFPVTTAKKWKITIYYSQNLRISEINLIDKNRKTHTTKALRFLARPNENYQIYLNPETTINLKINKESANLSGNLNSNLIKLGQLPRQTNPGYTPLDTDKDGLTDSRDNCPKLANPDQKDINQNRIGDACEDFDKDGILNAKDNCPNHPNRYQQDKDRDGIGDHCDNSESRLVERLAWLPWVGIGLGFIIVLVLLRTTMKKQTKIPKRSEEQTENSISNHSPNQ